MNHGILMRKGDVITQYKEGLSFGQAYSLCVDLRKKKDGNYYWIGTLK